jgi:Outer membrane receptor for ferric coprogen and ferric-rhodotorulic acid
MKLTLPHPRRLWWLAAGAPFAALSAFGQSQPASNSTDEVVVLSPFEVHSTSEEGYYSPEAVGATRTRTPLINLPVNVTVFNENFINDIGARDLVDIVSFASGVGGAATNASDNAGGDTLGFNLRGQGGFVPSRNGVRRLRVVDSATISRVEVLKGPNSLLYGPASPGGGVNYITKRPVQRQIFSTRVDVGSYDFYKATVDVNVPTASKNLAFRFVGSYEDSKSWIDRLHKHQTVLYPSMTWWIRPETTLTVEWEHTLQDRDPSQNQFPSHQWIDPDDMARTVGLGWNSRGPHDFNHVEMTALTIELQHKINDNFRLRLNWADVSWEDNVKTSSGGMGVESQFNGPALNNTNTDPSTGGIGPPTDGWVMPGRGHSYGNRGSWDKYRQAELYNTFEVAGVKVQNLFGYQLGQEKFINVLAVVGGPADSNKWSLKDPSTWVLSERFLDTDPLNYNQGTGTFARNTMNSGYAINQLSFFDDKLHTMVGARLDKLRGDNYLDPTEHNTTPWVPGQSTPPPKPNGGNQVYTEAPSHVSPQYGILFKPVKNLSFFANYSKSLVNLYTTVARRPDGTQFVPTPGSGEGYDFGVKSDMFGGKISGTLSFFQVDERDIVRILAPVTVPGVNDGNPFNPSEQSGINRSQGVELDLAYRPRKGTQIIASYAYNYSWVVSDTASAIYLGGGMPNGFRVENRTGHQLAYSARHRGSVHLRQDLGAFGPFTATYVTVSGHHVEERPYTEAWYKKITSPTDGGTIAEPGKIDAYTLFNVGFGATFNVGDRELNAILMVRNVFDERYLATRNYWGNPREVTFTLRADF